MSLRILVSRLCVVGLLWFLFPQITWGQPPADLMIETAANGFTSPLAIRHPGDGSGRLFVVQQAGLIRVVDGSGTTLATPFLDLTSVVVSGGEQGLLGLAFHPNYSQNGFFYVNYTRSGSPNDATVVARYTVSAADPNVADPSSALVILEVDQPFANHNGGDIHFSPMDGYLYIGMGDGGGFDTAQDLSSLLGKMLRIDVDGGTPYAIPADNPYVGNASARDEIWASGLRNPWRWSFDRQTGDLLIGDVGEDQFEEMNWAANGEAGLNYGWPCREGTVSAFPQFCDGSETLEEPFFANPRSSGACSMIGGFVYRGSQIPSLNGWVMFSDWCSGHSFFARQTAPDTWDVRQWDDVPQFTVVGYGEDESGELYMTLGGEIGRLSSASGMIFGDGFESGNTSDWSSAVP